jgi:uncharacterized membrane protein YedE/YeeE
MLIVAAMVCGFIFGWGLLISGMVQPAKVIGFLDIFGAWDPNLGVVMAAALVVSRAGFTFATWRNRPILASQSFWPTKTDIDRPLVAGATLFGIGWGLVGLCPGPALENLATLSPRVIAFVAAMALGMVLHDLRWKRSNTTEQRQESFAVASDG